MQRYGRVLRLREGAEAEYKRMHDNIWPQVAQAIREAGIKNYTIFRYGRWLFSYFELPEGHTLEDVARVTGNCEACTKWEELMHEYQEPLPESSGDLWWVPMEEVWRPQGV